MGLGGRCRGSTKLGPSKKREPVRSVRAAPPIVSCPPGLLLPGFSKFVSFYVSFPHLTAATRLVLSLGCRGSSRMASAVGFLSTVPPALVTDGTASILQLVDLCRRCSAKSRSWAGALNRAAVVVRSVKLVHQRIESGEAGMFSWPMLPVSNPRRSCSARFCRSVEPPFRSTCRCQVPARSHDGSPCANPFRGDSHSYRSNSPWPQRVKLPTGIRSCSDANECDPIPTDRFSWELQPTLEHASAGALDVPSGRVVGHRLHHCPRP